MGFFCHICEAPVRLGVTLAQAVVTSNASENFFDPFTTRICSEARMFLDFVHALLLSCKLHLVLLRSCKSYFTWPGNNCFCSPYSWHFTVIRLNLFNCSISSFHSTVDPSIISCTCSIYTIGARVVNTRFNSYKNMWFLKVEHLKEARSMKPSIICLLRQFIWWKLESSISLS